MAVLSPAIGNGLRRTLCRVLLGITLIIGLLRGADEGAPTSYNEYQVKAGFLFNFVQFAEWPSTAFADAKAPIVIGVLGRDPFGSFLDELVRDEKIGGRPIAIRRCRELGDAKGCHLLFVCRSDAPPIQRIISDLKGQSVLTISDADAFTRAGGMVQFLMEGGKVRLRINVMAAKACGLTISSKILRPATIVTTGKD
jgi:hypothetical protein